MKKLISVILLLALTLSLCLPALADGSSATTGEVISQYVSLYKKANTSSGYTRRLSNGTTFNILEDQGTWLYVEVANDNGGTDTGWVQSAYIIENPIHIVLRNKSGIYALAAPYNTDKRVGTVSNYDRFTVIAETGNYYIVSFRNAVCYLKMDSDKWLIEEDWADVINGPTTEYVTTNSKTNIYGYATTKYGSVGTYKSGVTVDVLYIVDGFAAIKYKSAFAFISLSDLQMKP